MSSPKTIASRSNSLIIQTLFLAFMLALPGCTFAAHHQKAPRVESLSWLTGSWSGAAGKQILEENWSQPRAGSMGAFVRFVSNDTTQMVELLTIEELDDTLIMHVQQWARGMKPLRKGAQRMRLDTLGDKSVSFVSDSEGGLTKLNYEIDPEGNFKIEVHLVEGNVLNFLLAPL